MSDFFTRLAERTLGLALIIQPIKPSLFAPHPDAIGEMLLEISEESDPARTLPGTQQQAGMPTQTYSAENPTGLFECSQAELPLATATSGQSHSAEGPTTQFQHSQVESTPTQARQSMSDILPTNSTNDPLPQSNPNQSVDRRRSPRLEPFSAHIADVRRFPQAIHEIEAQPQQSRTPMQLFAPSQHRPELRDEASLARREDGNDVSGRENTAEINTISGTRMESTELLETLTLTHKQTIAHRVSQSAADHRDGAFPRPARRAPSAQTQLEATTSEPAIQVTIGRVEVRAVTTSAPTTRSQHKSTRPAPMSLDVYLRQQERGSRR